MIKRLFLDGINRIDRIRSNDKKGFYNPVNPVDPVRKML